MLRFMRVPAVVIALGLLVLAAMHAAAVAPGNPAFQSRWERTDDPVLSGRISRTWIWGPEASTGVLTESYQESPGGQRQVQYYDKSRMEINNPSADPNNLFYVTNGLLVVELMTGNLQKGDNAFDPHNPAIVNVAGDSDDPTGPTYVTLGALRHLPPLGDNALITQRVNRAGQVTNDPNLAGQNIRTAQRLTVPGIDHQIAAPFWEFMNSSGLVKSNGQYVDEALFTNPYYATGFPITEAYWASVKVANTYRDVLMQCFERRCLTYTPGNPAGFATEAGNVGQHYHTWRYVQIPNEGGATATSTSTTTGPTATSTAQPVTNYVFADTFGQAVDPANDMVSPYGLALDDDGNLYVTDPNTSRVQKFDPNGVLITQWGTPGTGDGQFTSVGAIAVSGNTVYVSDLQADRIQKFDRAGSYLGQLGTGPGTDEGEFDFPTGIAIDSAGNIYVVDAGNSRVQKFDSSGAFVTAWGTPGALDREFNNPRGITIDANDDVYVADQGNNRIQAFDSSGVYERQWGSAGSNPSQFQNISGLGIAPDTNFIYVADAGNTRVQAFTPAGSFVVSFGELGAGAGQLNDPNAVVVDGSARIFVADSNIGRVSIFSTLDYGYLGKIDGDSRGRFRTGGADGLALNPDNGNIYVADYLGNLIKVFLPDGTVVTEFGEVAPSGETPLSNPNDVAFGPNGLLYVIDGNNDRVVVFNAAGQQQFTWGSSGTGDGKFTFPTGISVDASGNVYVADGNNDRIQKFDATGQYLDQWGSEGTGDGQFDTPIDVHVHGQRVYVCDIGSRVQVFDLNGTYLEDVGDGDGSGNGQFSAPWRITTDPAGYIYVADGLNHRVQKFTPEGDYLTQFGENGTGNGQFSWPTGIAITINGDVVVADGGNARVQIFSPVP